MLTLKLKSWGTGIGCSKVQSDYGRGVAVSFLAIESRDMTCILAVCAVKTYNQFQVDISCKLSLGFVRTVTGALSLKPGCHSQFGVVYRSCVHPEL